MDNTLTWALELANREQPPASLIIVLGGPGPEVSWNPELNFNPLRSSRQVSFKLRGQRSALYIRDNDKRPVTTHISPDARKWYARHLERESELHELILDSAFGGKATTSGAIASTKIAAKTGLGLLTGIGGAALGIVIADAGLKSGSDDLVRNGLIISAGGIAWGWEIISEGYRKSVNEFKQDVDPSSQYRYVRYLPEYLWVAWSDQPLNFPLTLNTSSGTRATLQKPGVAGRTSVTIAFIPDAAMAYSYYRW